MTTVIQSDFVNVLRNRKVLYMPTCIVVEMMTRLYGQVALINMNGNMHSVVPDLLILLRRLNLNLKCTSEAYADARVSFFVGDWKEDKLRARKLFFNLMSRLGYLSELVGTVERRLIYKAIEEMGNHWANLGRIMDMRSAETRFRHSCGPCKYFRSMDSNGWCRAMANVVLYLDSISEYPDDNTHLMLVCYDRVRTQLLEEIENIELVTAAPTRFKPEKILCASYDNFPVSCPTCSRTSVVADVQAQAAKRSRDTAAVSSSTRVTGRGISLKRRAETKVSGLQRGLSPAFISGYNYCPPAASAL